MEPGSRSEDDTGEHGCDDVAIAPRPPVDGHFLRFLYKCFQIHSSSASMAEVTHGDWEELKELGLGLSLEDCFVQLRLLSSEGLLDGIVPYAAHQSLLESSAHAKEELRAKSRVACGGGDGLNVPAKRRPQTALPSPSAPKFDIVLNVVDDAKHATKEYKIPCTTLLEHMGYFSTLASSQKLEDVDITVHCDISVFDWLMSWIKRKSKKDEETLELTPKVVVPVLISAEFLQMEKLVEYGLLFLKNRLQEVIPHTPSFSILGDALLERLAKLVHQSELESLDDPKDRVKTKLFCKLISLLVAPVGDHSALIGQFASAATLFKCSECGKLLTQSVVELVDCVPGKFTFTRTGSVMYQHQKDPRWSLNDYLKYLRAAKGLSWRRIYWHLWGVVHFFRCTRCGATFPAQEMGCCWFHPELAEYHWLEANASKHPVGRFPCCDMRAWRFDPLPSSVSSQTSGCHRTDHSVQLVYADKSRQDAVLMMYDELMSNRDLVCWGAPSPTSPSTAAAVCSRSSDAADGRDDPSLFGAGGRGAVTNPRRDDACRNSTFWLDAVVNPRPFADGSVLVNLARIGVVAASSSSGTGADEENQGTATGGGSFDGGDPSSFGRLESQTSLRQSSTEDDDSDLAEDDDDEEEEEEDDDDDGDGSSSNECAEAAKPAASTAVTPGKTPSAATAVTAGNKSIQSSAVAAGGTRAAAAADTAPAAGPSPSLTAPTSSSSAKQALGNRTSHLRRNRRLFNNAVAGAGAGGAKSGVGVGANAVGGKAGGAAAKRLRPATAAAAFASAVANRGNRPSTSITIQQRAKSNSPAVGFQALFVQSPAGTSRVLEKPKRWSYLFSTRHNQDNQRDYEMKIMGLLIRFYSAHINEQPASSAAALNSNKTQKAQVPVLNRDYLRGGSFARLERSWSGRPGGPWAGGGAGTGGAPGSGYGAAGGGTSSANDRLGNAAGRGLFKSRVRSAMGVLVEAKHY